MSPTPECLDAVIASSPFLSWLHRPESLLSVLLLILAEVIIHVFVGMRVLGGALDLVSWLATQCRRLQAWRQYRRFPLQWRVMCDWYGHGIWGIGRARVWVHQGRVTHHCPHGKEEL